MYIQNPSGFSYIQRADWLFFWLHFDIRCFFYLFFHFLFLVPIMFFLFIFSFFVFLISQSVCADEILKPPIENKMTFSSLVIRDPGMIFLFWLSELSLVNEFFYFRQRILISLEKIASQFFVYVQRISLRVPQSSCIFHQCLDLKMTTAISKIICAIMLNAILKKTLRIIFLNFFIRFFFICLFLLVLIVDVFC